MELKFEQMKDLVTGAVYMEEEDGFLRMHRFTKEQEEMYRELTWDFFYKTPATAGIKLNFQTDSEHLGLKVKTSKASLRSFFSVDVLVDGERIGSIDNFSDRTLPQDYTKEEFAFGEYEKTFSLGEGVKQVCVHLPWSVATLLAPIIVDDGAFVRAVKPAKKMLVFGDSITHGYDALRPSNRYAAKLAEKMDAEEYCKAIGGEGFCPYLLQWKEAFEPDYILVAYGTNDWNKIGEEKFMSLCREFYATLHQYYPNAVIFALTPIWRKDMHESRPFGPFEKVEEDIRECVKDLANVKVISGMDFVPHDENLYADLRLHPNDEGFTYYFEALYERIKEQTDL